MERCARIFTQPHLFPEFNFSWLSRERRSQRREALALVGMAEIYRMDLASSRVGEPIPGTPYLKGIPVEKLAEWTGLSYSRAARAVQDFTRARYQTGRIDKRGRLVPSQPREWEDDPVTKQRVFRARPAVRRFEPIFFRRLGATVEVDRAVKRAREDRAALAKEALVMRQAQDQRRRIQLHTIREARILEHNSSAARAAEAQRAADEATARRRTAIALEVWREWPEDSAEARRAEVERRLAAEQPTTGPPE